LLEDGDRFITGTFAGHAMLRDLARGSKIAFTLDEYSERITVVFNLTGTAVMTKVLRECSLIAVGLNPKDPFVG